MSQTLTPVSGGVQEIQTSPNSNTLQVYSRQYVELNRLSNTPTEWTPGGRPIYRRLPGTSETYQIDFFNLVPAPNTAVAAEVEDIGFVYVPWSGSSYGQDSLEVSTSSTAENVLIKSGNIVWKYGRTQVVPTIVNLKELDVLTGSYDLAYQLIYDDSPIQQLYLVEDFSLCGYPLTITSSTDSVIGWRHPAVNAFQNTSDNYWANSDSFFPAGAQPVSATLSWDSELSMALTRVTLRCPPGTAYTGTATVYYGATSSSPIETTSVQSDSEGQFYSFTFHDPVFVNQWTVEFTDTLVSVQSLSVSGIITQYEQQSAPSTRAVLVMYPTGTFPRTVTTSSGKVVSATYCPLATLQVSSHYTVDSVRDTRYIIHRDYTPVADWLTRPFDDDLINLYEQVSDYSTLWMAPPVCLKQEYANLTKYQVTVEIE